MPFASAPGGNKVPEDLPKAVMILLWLLIGVIIIGVLILETDLIYSVLFAAVYYGLTSIIYLRRKAKES